MRRYSSVLVTGGSRGLGAALARELLARDYRVIVAARTGAELQRLADESGDAGRERLNWVEADLSRPAGATELAQDVVRRFGAPDVLVNNAGIGWYKEFASWTVEEVSDCVHVNLLAPMLLTHALLPHFVQRKRGMVINIASDLARRYLANMAPYVATKSGLLGFSGSLLREVKAQGVKVTSVLPGIIDSAFNSAVEGSKDESWALRPAMLASRIVDLMELPEHVVVDEITVHPLHQDF